MEDAKQLWSVWQHNLEVFRPAFTSRGWRRFAQWTTATVLCDEEHTITQEALSCGLVEQWRNWEHLSEYGAWDERQVERSAMRLVEQQCPCRLGGYRPAAVDDTKEMRSSRHVWGVCTFKHVSRNPKHPKLVAGHNWVVMGELCPHDGNRPWTYLPEAARLYLRQSQLPQGQAFRTKNELAVDMLRELSGVSAAPVLGIFDGGFARRNVVRPCVEGQQGRPIQVLTRPRSDARLYRPLPPQDAGPKGKKKGRGKRKGGRPRKWGRRLPAPKAHRRWKAAWQKGKAWVYGKVRSFRCKQVDCRWSVSGPDVPVRAFVFEVQGYGKPWFIITSALDLSAAQVLEAYAARFRQEDGIRDHKQRLGMEQVRAWTERPVLRTFLVQLICLTLLRLLGAALERTAGATWYAPPPWNPHKTRVSILDLRRLLWRHRAEFSQFMRQLDELPKPDSAAA